MPSMRAKSHVHSVTLGPLAPCSERLGRDCHCGARESAHKVCIPRESMRADGHVDFEIIGPFTPFLEQHGTRFDGMVSTHMASMRAKRNANSGCWDRLHYINVCEPGTCVSRVDAVYLYLCSQVTMKSLM